MNGSTQIFLISASEKSKEKSFWLSSLHLHREYVFQEKFIYRIIISIMPIRVIQMLEIGPLLP